MSDCTCSGSDASISFRNSTGANIMTFVRLCSGTYFGGRKHDAIKFVPAPHMWMQVGGMLNLIATLANDTEDCLGPFSMTSGFNHAEIERTMRADDIARVLGCEAQEVVDHFSLMIKIAPPGASVHLEAAMRLQP